MRGLMPLTTPEVRRLLLALQEPPERFGFRLAWSRWRRRHQATAKRGHVARRARRPRVLAVAADAGLPVRPARSPDLTEDQWQRVLPLLPPQQPLRGRPNSDHRRIVAALLWVERTGCSWRSIPPHFGPWHTIYSRYQRWRTSGLWAQIRKALDQPEDLQACA